MSNLLKFALVQRDETFIQRVSAAMLIRAREINGWELTPTQRSMTDYVQANPLVAIPEMILTVATNAEVSAAIEVAHGVADASNVEDQDIQYVVNEQWGNVADKAFPAA